MVSSQDVFKLLNQVNYSYSKALYVFRIECSLTVIEIVFPYTWFTNNVYLFGCLKQAKVIEIFRNTTYFKYLTSSQPKQYKNNTITKIIPCYSFEKKDIAGKFKYRFNVFFSLCFLRRILIVRDG